MKKKVQIKIQFVFVVIHEQPPLQSTDCRLRESHFCMRKRGQRI